MKDKEKVNSIKAALVQGQDKEGKDGFDELRLQSELLYNLTQNDDLRIRVHVQQSFKAATMQ